MFARRIDYFFVSKSMQENIKNVKIYKDIYGYVPMEISIKETKR
jgi:exonuclease III